MLGSLASLAAIAHGGVLGLWLLGPASSDGPDRFEPQPDDPSAANYQPRGRLKLDSWAIPIQLSNHVVRVFGLERPHAYGLDLQVGYDMYFWGQDTALLLRPQTGYAFVHHRDFASHASITGMGTFLIAGELISLCYTPRFVGGAEARQRLVGFRQGISLGYVSTSEVVALEIQHGISWVGSAGPRHELRGTLSIDLVQLSVLAFEAILLASWS